MNLDSGGAPRTAPGRQDSRAERAARALEAAGLTIAVAESCTGGLLGGAITEAAGASSYFMGGVISYSDEVKEQLLGVSGDLLKRHGAVSPQVALAMAEGVRKAIGTDLGLSITGIAGPDGGTPEKPVGTAYIALSAHDTHITRAFRFGGDRASNRAEAVGEVLGLLADYLEDRGSR